MDKDLIQDRWYWVTYNPDDKTSWFPAMYDKYASNNWTNQDTWQDFDRRVAAWKLIPLPEELP